MNYQKLHLTLLAILLISSLKAQRLQVVSFTELGNDLTAQQAATSKLDQNGEVTALIKILTPELQDLSFDGGSLGVVGTELKGGEWWLYVPADAQRLTITHPLYGVLRNYIYPQPILQGHTYRMVLDIGLGCYVTIQSPADNTEVEIDGRPMGKAPLVQQYLLYGIHTIQATSGQQEAVDTIFLSSKQEKEQTFQLRMHEAINHFGNVRVTVADNADIFFHNELVGKGTWQQSLREGTYEIETRRENCNPAKTTFSVTAGIDNLIEANPPTEHLGWLSIYTRPKKVEALFPDGSKADLRRTVSKPAGIYKVKMSNPYYFPEKRTYTIENQRITIDTLEFTSKYSSFYFGYNGKLFGSQLWHGGTLGFNTWFGFDLCAEGYPQHIFTKGEESAKVFCFSGKTGWRFSLSKEVAVTPQIGWLGVFIDEKGGKDASTGHLNNLFGGVRLDYSPIKAFRLHFAAYYSEKLANDDVARKFDVKSTGFSLDFGAVICINAKAKSNKYTK